MIHKAIWFFLLSVTLAAQAQTSPQEKQLFEQLNASRKEAGLAALEWDEHLAEAARAHSERMAAVNELGHVLKGEPAVADRIAATGLHFNRSGENVGYDSDFDNLHQSWMNSPPHRENILSPNYNVVGIGVARTEDGLWYGTQDFAHALPQRTAAQAEDVAAQAFADMRKKDGRSPLERMTDAQVRGLACRMAKTGRLDARAALELPGVTEAVVYNNAFPEELPESARKLARSSNATRIAVGACFAPDAPGNPGGTFFVVMTFYP